MSDSQETLAGGPSAALPLPVVPVTGAGSDASAGAEGAAAVDPEVYEAWRKHIERGFDNNNRMFDRTLNAFMYPYWVTVGMYVVLFVVGISAFIVAARLSFEGGKELYTVLFGGLGVAAFLTFFLTRPLQALEENLQFITWLGIIYNTYWTRLAYMNDQQSVQRDLETATTDTIAKLKDLLATHADRSGKRPGLR